MAVDITYDEALIEEIAARFDLRDPNKNALATIEFSNPILIDAES